jgi:cell division protein FtsW
VRLRIDIWLNPWQDADGRAYQIVQSLMAFAAGGVFGQGIGQGVPYFIPVVHSDFIFAALAEEWGLIGVASVIALQSVFTARGLRIALLQGGKPFPTLVAVGLSAIITIQTLLIMGGVLKLIPLTGVTLPFFSYGGSSLVVTFALTGILLRLSTGD